MAYDGYHSQQDPHQPPYTSSYDSTYDPRAYQTASFNDGYYHEKSRPRSPASSNAQPDSPQQPLHNALNNAFDKSDTARAVDPDLIAQITAEVKKSVLDEIKLNGALNGTLNGAGATSIPAPQYIPQSPSSTTASFPSRNVYTPPSPKHYDYPAHSHRSASPEPLSRQSTLDNSGDTPTPRDPRNANDAPQHDRTSRSRPPPASRMSQEFTPIEKMWQYLFDPQGRPLPRLGQFLRGLAIHLIDDYEPKKSLVITPSKMAQFYDDVKLSDEIYPWQNIFGKLPLPALSKIYRELRCEHHFVQEHLTDSPCVPALTPKGFEMWVSVMIQAYPDTEYERLSKAVLDMPISNADDAKERFPKELPRRLFPSQENLQSQQRCAAVLSAEGVGPLRRAPTFPPPPASAPPPSLERERSPYATRPESKTFESDDDSSSPLSVPIERQRKPYSSTPGGGKFHDDDLSQSLPSNSSTHDQRKRAQSTAGQSQWNPPTQHPRTWSQATTDRRQRSPSFTGYGTRSDPNVRDVPGSYTNAHIYDSEEETRRYAKEAEMKRSDWSRRQAEEESTLGGHHRRSTVGTDGSYDSQPRSVYDDDNYKNRSGSNGYDSRGYEPRRY